MIHSLITELRKILSEIPRTAFFFIFTFLAVVGCSNKENKNSDRIVVGIESDVQTINPMYAFSLFEGDLIDLLFMKPADEIWNDSLGIIEFQPMLAKKWEWSDDGNSLQLYLRDDIFWSDGNPITIYDIIYTFDIYSDPNVESRFFGQFQSFYTIDGQQIDIEKTFKVISPSVLEINFKKDSNPTLLDVNLEIIPKHIWSKYK
ncbi:MAG: ABC transporter substrate-binding protein, partial [Ignavibacteriaceae bacterium]|nr:ABC transporter substrate-binding protein [Ignavibacteriaceae bacterium]